MNLHIKKSRDPEFLYRRDMVLEQHELLSAYNELFQQITQNHIWHDILT
jgi:hypothetical protein